MPLLPAGLRDAICGLARKPGYALAVMATLALGIGATTAVFGVLDQTVFRKPQPHFERLVVFGGDYSEVGFIGSAYAPEILPCIERARSFEAYALNAWGRGTLDRGDATLGFNYARVNPEYGEVLGARVMLGRFFNRGDFAPGADEVIALDPLFWAGPFGGDPAVIGRHVVIDGRTSTIVGVLARDFVVPKHMGGEVLMPLKLTLDPAKPFRPIFTALARLRPGATLAQANAEVAVLGAGKDAPPVVQERIRSHPLRVIPLAQYDSRWNLGTLHGVFMGAIGFLYAIACLNAVNLLLVRLGDRRRELGIRLALGASRRDLLRLLGLENLVLTLGAGLVSLPVARTLMPALMGIVTGPETGVTFHLDLRAYAFAVGFSLLTLAFLALVPAWRVSRMNVQESLKDGGAVLGESPRLRRLREALVVMGTAMALVVLTGTGLMARSVHQLLKVDRGFNPAGKAAIWLDLPKALEAPEARYAFSRSLEERLQGLPGIRRACMAATVPLVGSSSTSLRKPDGSFLDVGYNAVSPGFMDSMGLKLVRGRWIPERQPGAAAVVVINEALAKAWFGTEDPIGRQITFASDPPWEVIGIVQNLRPELREAAGPQCYVPNWQGTNASNVVSLLLDFQVKPTPALLKTVLAIVHETDARVGVRPPVELERAAREQVLAEARVLAAIGLVAVLALLLAVLGLFSLLTYLVNRRLPEFGIRLALGASPRRVGLSVLGRGLLWTGTGIGLGLFLAWGLTRFIRSLLFETRPLEPGVYAGMAALLLGVAALACWLPARKASRVEPAGLLRSE